MFGHLTAGRYALRIQTGTPGLHHAVKEFIYRKIRCNPVVERVQTRLRRREGAFFHEIGLVVPATVGDIIIDGGANVGMMTSKFARTGATVHAFEPNPVCYGILRKRFAMQPSVHVHHLGLMDKECTLSLSTPVAHNGFDSIEVTVASSFVAETFDALTTEDQVKCIDASEFVLSLGKPVALLKLDIEGAEIAVLNRLMDTGAIDQVKFTVVETHERFSREQAEQTEILRERIEATGLSERVRLDWI